METKQNKRPTFRQQIYRTLKHWRLVYGSRRAWKSRYRKVKYYNPQLFQKLDNHLEREHKLFWRGFSRNINIDTLRVSSNLSGKTDFLVIPEEVYCSHIEPILNLTDFAKLLEVKNIYNHWFGADAGFPTIYVNKIDHVCYDSILNLLTSHEIDGILSTLNLKDVVIKPSRGSYGGRDVVLSPTKDTITQMLYGDSDVVLQERIYLDPDYSAIAGGKPVSTRIYMYRSLVDNKWYFITSVLRMALGSSLDNETSGGIATYVSEDGVMNGYAVDKYGTKYYQHPETLQTFDKVLPHYDQMIHQAVTLCDRIPFARIVGFDFLYSVKRQWRPLEVNLFGGAIRFAQYHGKPFFGRFTDEVVDYCMKQHRNIL
jgi:hypothetical protein